MELFHYSSNLFRSPMELYRCSSDLFGLPIELYQRSSRLTTAEWNETASGHAARMGRCGNTEQSTRSEEKVGNREGRDGHSHKIRRKRREAELRPGGSGKHERDEE